MSSDVAPVGSYALRRDEQQDMAELGERLRSVGFNDGTARAIVAKTQGIGTRVALETLPEMLTLMRELTRQQIKDLAYEVGSMRSSFGWVRQDQVLHLINLAFLSVNK